MALEKPRGIRTVLAIYVAAFAGKAAVFVLTGYLALLADALNSLTDIAMALIMLASFRFSRIPADESHPFGHGRGESAAALIAGVAFITVVSFGIIRESVPRLFEPIQARGDPGVAIGVLLLAVAVNAVGIVVLRRDLTRGNSPASRALMVDLFNDQVSAVAAILGIWGASHGYPVADPVAGLAIGLIIAYTALQLVRNNVVFLMGESPGRRFYVEVEETVLSVRGVENVHDVMAEYIGPGRIHVDLHIRVDPSMTVAEVDPLTEDVRREIEENNPQVVHTVVHVCPHGGTRRATVE